MPSPRPRAAPDLQALLRGVSRSFYLSIRLLPAPIRAPVGLGYLLARATDTIADTARMDPLERERQLLVLADAVAAADCPAGVDALVAAFTPLQQDADERRLIQRLPECLRALAALADADRHDVQAVLRTITQGQRLDVQRFGAGGAVRALRTRQELDEYTWLVAGCVGEFWTDVCARHLPDFADLPLATLRSLGRDYGCGLQLVNILRDLGADLAQGRCYLPEEELAAAGLHPSQVAAAPPALRPVWQAWHARALAGMDAGLRYGCALRGTRLRVASTLPALLGARTLALLQAAGPQSIASRIRMPRGEVRGLLWRLVVTGATPRALAASHARLRAGGPVDGWDNPAR